MTKLGEYDATADLAFGAIIIRIRLIRVWAIVAVTSPVVRSWHADAPTTIASPMSTAPMAATPMSPPPNGPHSNAPRPNDHPHRPNDHRPHAHRRDRRLQLVHRSWNPKRER